MGKGGLYGKRHKREPQKPSQWETTTSSGGTRTRRKKSEAETRYGGYTKQQSYDTSLSTTRKRKFAHERGRRKSR